MDPFSSFDLFRRRVDQMFADFDQQMFGASDPFDSHLFGQSQPQLQQQQQQRIGHEKSSQIHPAGGAKEKEEERVIPHRPSSQQQTPAPTTNPNRGLSTRQPPSSNLSLFNWPSGSSFMTPSILPSMKLDVVEEKNQYLIHADVPGLTKDNIHLQIENGVLTVRGETSQNKEEHDPDRKYHRVERSSGSVFRSMRLPEGIKEEEVSASCENGVLKVVLPKMEQVEKKKERKIRIE
jgi:HSP20 family protein